MTIYPQKTLRFDEFTLEPGEMRLRHKEKIIHITPKAFEILTHLLNNPHRLVKKEELMRAVWGDSFVEESNLNVTISMIRRTLAKFSDKQYIETISKVGYRFSGDVVSESVAEANGNLPPKLVAENREKSPPSERPTVVERREGSTVQLPATVSSSGLRNSQDRNSPVGTAPRFTDSEIRRALRPTRISVMVGIGLTVALSILIFTKLSSSPNSEQKNPVKLLSITSAGNIGEAAISPDGKFLAYSRIEKDKQSLWLKNTRTTDSEILLVDQTTDEFKGMRFTPDGARIFYNIKPKNNSITDLYAMAVLGGSPKLIARDVDSPAAISPDGKRFAFMRRDVKSGITTLFLAAADGTEIRELSSRTSPSSYMLKPLDWSPDGLKLLCVGTDQTSERKRTLIEIEVETGKEKPIGSQVWDTFDSVAWSNDGRGIYFSASDVETPLRRQLWYRSYPDGTASQISTDLYDYSTVSIAKETGEIVALHSTEESTIWLWNFETKQSPKRLALNPTTGQHGVALINRDRVIFTDGLNGVNSLHIADFELSGNKELTTPSKSIYRSPLVTKDGSTVVYISAETGIKNIWKMKIDGSERVQITSGKNDEEFPSLSPNDQWIYYNTVSKGQTSIWRVSINGGEPVKLTEAISLRPQVSLDGKKIACYFRSAPKADWQLGILPVDGGEVIQTVELPSGVRLSSPFRWSKDGKSFIVVDKSSGIDNLARLDIDTGEISPLTSFTDELLPNIYSFDCRSDGLFVITRGRETRNVVNLNAN